MSGFIAKLTGDNKATFKLPIIDGPSEVPQRAKPVMPLSGNCKALALVIETKVRLIQAFQMNDEEMTTASVMNIRSD